MSDDPVKRPPPPEQSRDDLIVCPDCDEIVGAIETDPQSGGGVLRPCGHEAQRVTRSVGVDEIVTRSGKLWVRKDQGPKRRQ